MSTITDTTWLEWRLVPERQIPLSRQIADAAIVYTDRHGRPPTHLMAHPAEPIDTAAGLVLVRLAIVQRGTIRLGRLDEPMATQAPLPIEAPAAGQRRLLWPTARHCPICADRDVEPGSDYCADCAGSLRRQPAGEAR